VRAQLLALFVFCVATTAAAADLEPTTDAVVAPPLVTGPGVESSPNIFGGEDFHLPNGDVIESSPNISGGLDYHLPDGRTLICVPNIAGGQDCR